MTRFFFRAISELPRNFACTRSLCHRLLLQASIGQVNGLSAQWQNWALQMSALEGCQNPSTSSCISGVFGLTSMGQDFPQNLLDLDNPILRLCFYHSSSKLSTLARFTVELQNGLHKSKVLSKSPILSRCAMKTHQTQTIQFVSTIAGEWRGFRAIPVDGCVSGVTLDGCEPTGLVWVLMFR